MEVEQSSTKLEQLLNNNDRQIINLQKELLKVKKANQGLNEEKNNLIKQIHDKEKVIGGLEEEKVEAMTEHSLLSLDSTHYKKEAEIYDEYLKLNLAKTDFFVTTIKQLDKELRTKLDSLKESDRQNVLLTTEKSVLESLENAFEQREVVYKSTIEKLFEDMNSVYQSFQTKTADLEHKLEIEQTKNQQLQSTEGNLNITITNLTQSLEEHSNSKEVEIHNLTKAIDLNLGENKLLKEDINRLTGDLKLKNSHLEERERKTIQSFQEKTQKINSLSQEAHSLQNKLVEKEALIKRLSEQNRQIQVRETLLNKGLELYESQKEELELFSKEEVMEQLRKANEALALEKGEKAKLLTQFNDIKREMAEKVPLLLDKHAEFNKASEENEHLKKRIDNVMEEMTKIYQEKTSYEKELKKLKEESNFQNFDAAFLNNQVSKLLIQNNKLKMAFVNGTGGESIENILLQDTEPGNSVFFSDIDDLQKKYNSLVKRFKELKNKKEREVKQEAARGNKRLSRMEEEADDVEETERSDVFRRKNDDVKETIEKKRKTDMDLESKVLKEAQEAKIRQLNVEVIEYKSKLRKAEQDNSNLQHELQIEKNTNNYQRTNQNLNLEENFRKAKDNESEIKRLLDERELLNKKLIEKEKNLSDFLGKVNKLQTENLDLKTKLNLAQKDLEGRRGFEERLNQSIQESQRRPLLDEKDSSEFIRNLQEENLIMKMKFENQAIMAKSYKDRCSNLQTLLGNLSKEFQANSQKMHQIFFEDEIKDSYNSSSQEVFHLRAQLHELKEIVNFYKQELYAQTGEYQEAFDRVEKMTGAITENFSSLGNKFTEQETELKDRLKNMETEHMNTIHDLQSKVDEHLDDAAQEEVYEDTDWVHVSEYQQLEGKLRKEEENSKALHNTIEEMREHLLHEREANLKQSSVQQQENEHVKKYLIEINTLTTERNNLNDALGKLRDKSEIQQQQLNQNQDNFDRNVEALTQENSTLREELNRLSDSVGKVATENIEQAGILALEQRNNLLKYLREKNNELAFERDQLKSKLFAHRKTINTQKAEKLQQIEQLENELRSLRNTQELQAVPHTTFLKGIIEENKNLHQENTKNKKMLTKQDQQIKIFEQYQREENEQEANSPVGLEEEDEEFGVSAEKVLALLERAKAQYELLKHQSEQS